jgi:glucan phosphorylase
VATIGVNELVVVAAQAQEWVGRHVVFSAGKAEPMNIKGKNVIVVKIADVVSYWSV